MFNNRADRGSACTIHAKPEEPSSPVERIARADEFFAGTGATIQYGGSRACYTQEAHRIQMPVIEAFRDVESFYATLAHESAHWTRHSSRLKRHFGRKVWGDEGYAQEELVAELASAFLCADLALTPEVRDDHAAYIARG